MERDLNQAQLDKDKMKHQLEIRNKSLEKHVSELEADIQQMNQDKHNVVDIHEQEI